MMTLCPFCGHHLPRALQDGITSCLNCRRICDSTRFNNLLSLAWVVRKQNIDDVEHLVYKFGVTHGDAEFVISFVAESCYSHEDFLRLLKEIDIKDYQKIQLDLAS